jgi:hypothetical protein
MVTYEDGDTETMSLAEAKELLKPKGTKFKPKEAVVNLAVTSAWQLKDLPQGLDLLDPKQLLVLLNAVMPGKWHPPHVTRLSQVMPGGLNYLQGPKGYTPGEPQCVETLPQEIEPLLIALRLTRLSSVVDPFCGTKTISTVLKQCYPHLQVVDNDTNPAHSPMTRLDATQPSNYLKWTRYDAIITSPFFAVLDVVLPMMAETVRKVACVHVPGHYLTDPSPPRQAWLKRMCASERIQVISNLPNGPLGRRCVWLLLFRTAAQARLLVDPTAHAQFPVFLA